jgi:hypothetical protein
MTGGPQSVCQWTVFLIVEALGTAVGALITWLVMEQWLTRERAVAKAFDRAKFSAIEREAFPVPQLGTQFHRALGVVELLIYSSSVVYGVPEFIPAWLAVKYIAGHEQWPPAPIGRTLYNRSLFGSAVNVLLGFALGQLASTCYPRSGSISIATPPSRAPGSTSSPFRQ